MGKSYFFTKRIANAIEMDKLNISQYVPRTAIPAGKVTRCRCGKSEAYQTTGKHEEGCINAQGKDTAGNPGTGRATA